MLALAPPPLVVHSSPGRLRIHLPDATPETLTHLRRFPGVTHVSASALTGNVLILFHPHQLTEQALLGNLQSPSARPPSLAPVPQPTSRITLPTAQQVAPTPSATIAPRYVTGARRLVYVALGWTSVGLAVVGAILPGIPTVPFVVLASYFFIRSSPLAHDWLLTSRWFGPLLRDWEERHAVRSGVKWTALGLIALGIGFTLLVGLPLPLTAAILALELVGLAIVLRLPVIEDPVPAPAGA